MPNIKSAMKRMRSDARKREGNRIILSELNTLDKRLAATEKGSKEAKEMAKLVIQRYDRAVTKGAVPKGRADRRKSRISNFASGK